MPGAAITIGRVSPEDQARSFGAGVYAAAYERGLTVSQLLEQQDPTAARPEGERGLDAFERVGRELGIYTRNVPEYGVRASTYEEATRTSQQRAWLPEWAARVWRNTVNPQTREQRADAAKVRAILLSGDAAIGGIEHAWADDPMLHAPKLAPPVPLSSIIAGTRAIDSDGFRQLYIVDDLSTDAYTMKRVAEGAEIPSTSLVTGEHTIRLTKHGRAIRATYEQLRRQRLDRIAFIVARMAIKAESDKVTTVMNTIVSGDGNSNTAATVLNLTTLDAAASAGTLTIKGWLAALMAFGVAYQPNVVLAQTATMLQLLLLPFNTVNGMPLLSGPGMPALGGITPLRDQLGGGVRYGVTADAPSLKLVLFDGTQTVEQVTEIGGNVSEVERYISNQTQMLTLTEVVGFAISDPQAARVVNVNA